LYIKVLSEFTVNVDHEFNMSIRYHKHPCIAAFAYNIFDIVGDVCGETNEDLERITPLLLTTNVDFDFAEVHPLIMWNLHDEISTTRHVACTLQEHGSSVTDHSWILTAHVVVPQGRLCDVR